jgi:hypothetical protein
VDAAPDNPLGALEQLADRSGTPFPNLQAARARTQQRLLELRIRLADQPPTSLLGDAADADRHAVVLFGSWGRAELTASSDDDWALVVDGAEPAGHERGHLLAWIGDAVGADGAAPGGQGTFGDVVSAATLARNIGLEGDTNTNLTRRMLLLLESVPATGRAVWTRALRGVLDAYLDPTADGGDYQPPRFLLNDLVRYWRTIAVDFEGKHRASGHSDEKWVMRNAKLRLSRKLLFAGGLIPVLLCRERPAADMATFLERQLAAPPTDRIAAAFLAAQGPGVVDIGARTLGAYDRWVGVLADRDKRDELSRLTREDRSTSAVWREVRELGEQLEEGLLALLFQTEIAPVSQRYLIF